MFSLSSASHLFQWASDHPFAAAMHLALYLVLLWATRWIHRIYVWNLYLSPLNKIPGPPPINVFPPLGHFPEIFREEACAPHMRWMREYAPDTGILRYHSLLLTPHVMITNPDILRYTLSVHNYEFPKEPVFGPLKHIFGTGLLFSEGSVHKRQRRLLNPSFSYRHVREMVPAFWNSTWHLAEVWGVTAAAAREATAKGLDKHTAESNGHSHGTEDKAAFQDAPSSEYATIDVHETLGVAALDMIGVAGFGNDFKGLEGELAVARARLRKVREGGTPDACKEGANESALSRNYNKLMSSFGQSVIGVFFFFLPFLTYLYTPPNRRVQDEALRDINAAVNDIIERKRAEMRQTVDEGKDLTGNGKDLISLLMQEAEREGTTLTNEELRDQIMTFLTAGHETTALAVGWCLWLLAHNSEAQSKLYKELSSSTAFSHLSSAIASSRKDPFSSPNPAPVSADDVDQLKYLNSVLKESLRIVPPVPMASSRTVQKEFTVSVSKRDGSEESYTLPKGTVLMVAPLVNHMTPTYWRRATADGEEEMDDLAEFRPERWAEMKDAGEEGSSMSAVWMPFNIGPRGCIGQKLAIIEAKTVLAVLLLRFEFEPVPGYTVKKKLRTTWRPDRPLLLRVKERALQKA